MRERAQAAAREADKWRRKAEQQQASLVEYDAAVHALERRLRHARETVGVYHDRIVVLSGKDDKVVRERLALDESLDGEGDGKERVPLSSHLRAQGRLGQEFAAEKRHLEQRAAMADKALEAARAELAKAQADRFEAGREAERRMREQGDALAMAQHLLHTQAHDKSTKIAELERAVKQIGHKSDAHKKAAALAVELADARALEGRLRADAEFHARQAAAAKEEAQAHMTRVAALQARVHSAAQSVPSKSEMLITTMSEQIEAQAAQVERLEALLAAAKAEHDRQGAEHRSVAVAPPPPPPPPSY